MILIVANHSFAEQAVPKLERARVAHDLSARELQRQRHMVIGRETSLQELEAAEHKERMAAEDLKTAQFARQIADYELDLACAALTRTRPLSPGESNSWRFEVHAPVGGRVLRVLQESSAIITPGKEGRLSRHGPGNGIGARNVHLANSIPKRRQISFRLDVQKR
ncbi:MAG: hypothetical protein ACYC3I_20290 [Gemmataceae bacterium]